MRPEIFGRTPRGASAVIVAILIAMLAAFLALVINTGHGFLIRSELQNATDASALAGARELNGTLAGLDAARAGAVEYARLHETDNAMNVVIDPNADVLLGHWNDKLPRDAAFSVVTGRTPEDLLWINAVRVFAGRETDRGNAMPVAMGPLLDKDSVDVRTTSTAVFGGPCDDGCAVPIAFPDCIVLDSEGNLNCGTELKFASDGGDNIGFTSLSMDSVNTSTLRDILGGTCKPVSVGDPILVANGNQIPALKSADWPIGEVVSAPIVSLPNSTCPYEKFVTSPTTPSIVVGFASFTITRIDFTGNPKIIYIRLECQKMLSRPSTAGCNFFGTTASSPRLVR